MTPAEYKALLAEARDVEDPNDQEQVRRAEGKKHALEQWWEARVNEYLKTFKDVDVEQGRQHWHQYIYTYDLDPFGTILVDERRQDSRGDNFWHVNKVDIFSMLDQQRHFEELLEESKA